MATITTRAGKGSPLTNTEVDDNFSNLNSAKYESGSSPTFANSALINSSSTVSLTLDGASANSKNIYFKGDSSAQMGRIASIGTSLYFQLTDATNYFTINPGSTVINDSSVDHDFRVESNDNSHILFVDANTNNVGVGAGATPLARLHVNGGNISVGDNASKPWISYHHGVDFGGDSSPDYGWGGISARIDYVSFSSNYYINSASVDTIANSHGTGRKALELYMTAGHMGFRRSTNSTTTKDTAVTSWETPFVMYDSAEGAVVNESSNDRDFRVESDNQAHMFYVDATNDEIGVKTNNPATDFDVIGGIRGRYAFNNSAGAQVGSVTNNFWRIGTLTTFAPQATEITLLGSAGSYSTTGPIANQTKIIIRAGTSDTHLDGVFYSEGDDGTNIPTLGFVAEGSGVFTIYAQMMNYMSLEHEVKTGGTWVQNWLNTGSSSAPTGFQAFPAQFNIQLGNTSAVSMNQSATIFNENGLNVDFRVESDGEPYALFVDASTNRIGVKQSAPDYTIHVGDGAENQRIHLQSNGGGAVFSGVDSVNNSGNGFRWGHLNGTDRLEGAIGTTEIIDWRTNALYFKPNGFEVLGMANDFVTINNGSGDVDFRIESNDRTHMFFVDGGSNEIGVNESQPTSTLDVNGRIGASQFQFRGGNGSAVQFNRRQGWAQDNSSSDGSTWRILGYFTLPDNDFSSITLHVKTWYPGSNYGAYTQPGIHWENQVNVTRKTTSLVDAARIHGPTNNKLRVQRNHAGEWELQGRTEYANQGVMFEFTSGTSAGGASFAASEGISSGSTAGHIEYADSGDSVQNNLFGSIEAWGSTVLNQNGGNYDFRVESDTNSHAFFVDASSNAVVFGHSAATTTTASAYFGGLGTSATHLVITNTTSDSTAATLYLNRQSYDGRAIEFRKANSLTGDISVSTTGTTYSTTSDRRLKENIQTITDGTDKLMAMNPVTHTWKADPEAPSVHGFIAQEMKEIVPEAVSKDTDPDEMMSMDYGRITPVLVAALQDANKKIAELETRLNELEGK
jgi:hypothetical protein